MPTRTFLNGHGIRDNHGYGKVAEFQREVLDFIGYLHAKSESKSDPAWLERSWGAAPNFPDKAATASAIRHAGTVMRYLLDTNVCIEILRGRNSALKTCLVTRIGVV